MLPSGGEGRAYGETPAAGTERNARQTHNQSAALLPPSTAIRSRFRSITERPPAMTTVRGKKRYMIDDSPNGIGSTRGSAYTQQPSWLAGLETPVRGLSAHTGTSLADTILQPQRLFSYGSPPSGPADAPSPARSILEANQRESEVVGRLETLRRESERAKFELRQVEMERERDREEAQRVRQQLEADVLAQTRRVEKLERDRRWLFEQEDRLAEQRRTIEAELTTQRKKHQTQTDEMSATMHELKQRLDEANRSLRSTRAEHAEKLEAQQQRTAAAEETIARLKAQQDIDKGAGSANDASLQYTVETLKREMRDKDQDIEELQQKLKQLMGSEDASTTVSPSRSRVAQLERDLREQCAYIKAIEQQNRKLGAEVGRLADTAGKYEKERETVIALQAKVQRLEAQQEGRAEIEARLDAMQQEREQWSRVLNDGSDQSRLDSPFAIAKTVASQRHTIRMLESKVTTLQENAESANEHLQSTARDVQLYRQECARLEKEAAIEKHRATQIEQSKQHAVREAEFLRTQLHSYDREEEELMGGNYDRQKAERIRQLELFIDEQRAWISATQPGVAVQDGASSAPSAGADGVSTALLQGYREDAESKQRELEEVKTEHQHLLRRFEDLEKEAARLEHQVGCGLGYNPRTTRILQLIDNPSAQDYAIRSEKLKALAAENEALLERIRLLEKSNENNESDGNSDTPPDDATGAGSAFFHTIDNLRSENQNLTRQLEDSAKLISRYKKEWKKKAAELREVVYLILGYRVDFMSNGSVRFTSMYAAGVDQSFVFTSGDDDQGVMRLSGGGSKTYLKGLTNDIRYWVQERGSIPGFLATVTLQNFEAQADQNSQQQ
ncbi:MAD-domain-containing protein [Coemansia reversa NRRL 1564]|uniref:Spindle assembly checkpoint component MAD1 n=1 Tax=Coemansia reversa (strain ATCC 12441 / NRRL 1564) TaxID=763665 RepID=A0A2G5BHJ4_COERN|nr:MAD-domain-containing protein [Coemansia reversa NRRL 1564]|eukprot:PIA18496.1 MAD-domain-containing protein [Coemansia reversa NRRL 1564]